MKLSSGMMPTSVFRITEPRTITAHVAVLECVQSVMESKEQNFDIFVVDNASTDGSVEALKNTYKEEITILAKNPVYYNYISLHRLVSYISLSSNPRVLPLRK